MFAIDRFDIWEFPAPHNNPGISVNKANKKQPVSESVSKWIMWQFSNQMTYWRILLKVFHYQYWHYCQVCVSVCSHFHLSLKCLILNYTSVHIWPHIYTIGMHNMDFFFQLPFSAANNIELFTRSLAVHVVTHGASSVRQQ